MQTAFRMENLSSGYEQVRVFEGLNLTIEEGKVTTIIGPNGCGKSTLLKTIGRILKNNKVRFICRTKICKIYLQKTSQKS